MDWFFDRGLMLACGCGKIKGQYGNTAPHLKSTDYEKPLYEKNYQN